MIVTYFETIGASLLRRGSLGFFRGGGGKSETSAIIVHMEDWGRKR